MDPRAARERFRDAIRVADDAIDLADACFWISAEANPGLDVDLYRDKLAALAEGFDMAATAGLPVSGRVEQLNHHLFTLERYSGNREDYYDPRNSYLDCVLDRRTGIPITLSILWMAVADRLGIESHGVGFPGHFLVGVEAEPCLFVDAFSGEVLTPQGCRERLDALGQGRLAFDPAMLAPARRSEVIARVLRNLKQIHVQASDYTQAIACIDRILLLQPDLPSELRDRGLLHRALECWTSAREDLERFLVLAPDAAEASKVRRVLEDLRLRTASIH